MHGAGNDFVVLDGRSGAPDLAPAAIRRIADRRLGVGCDQIIIIEADADGADAFMRILNADGSEAGACGNATRCVAALLAEETGARRVTIRTISGLLPAEITRPWAGRGGYGRTAAWNGAISRWQRPRILLHLNIAMGPVEDPAACSMGNPHATFFVEESEYLPIETHRPGSGTQHECSRSAPILALR